MSATNWLTFTPTGHCCTQAGLAQSRHRVASVCASASGSPRFTSSKHWLRTVGSSSGIWTRGIAMRCLRGRTFFSGMAHFLDRGEVLVRTETLDLALQVLHFRLSGGEFGAQLRHLMLLVQF